MLKMIDCTNQITLQYLRKHILFSTSLNFKVHHDFNNQETCITGISQLFDEKKKVFSHRNTTIPCVMLARSGHITWFQ